MKKRAISFLLVVALLIGIVPMASAYSETDIAYPVEGGNIYFDKATGTITDCDDTVTGADIPAEIDGVAVTVIGNGAFSDCSSLTSVTIPDSVTSIGNIAFEFCSSLTSVTIPDSVTRIGGSAFSYCSSLTSVTIGDSVTTIGGSAFSYCSSLTSVTIPDSVTTIGDYAFYSCSSLTSVTIGDGVTTIGDYAFYSCDSLTSVTIGDGVTTIGNDAFYYCPSLTGIWVDEMNEAYSSDECGVLFNKDKSALIVCPDAYSGAYTIPDSVTNIGNGAFSFCDSLTSVTIPDSVTTIGGSAFSYCDSLTSVTIPDSVTSISNHAFGDCNGLTSVTIGNGVTSISDSAFYSCGSLTSVTIPDSVKSIAYCAFYWCSSLTSVMIGKGVESIADYAFAYCPSLKEITVDPANAYFSSDANGVLFNKDKTELITLPGASTLCEIPEAVTSIADGAFVGCQKLMAFRVDANNAIYSSDEGGLLLSKDGKELLLAPNALKICNVPDGVTYIAANAFDHCYELTTVILPASLTEIGDSVFSSGRVTHLLYAGTETQWQEIIIGDYNWYLEDMTKHFEATAEDITVVSKCTYDLYSCKLCDEMFLGAQKRADGAHDFVDGKCSVCGVPSYLSYSVDDKADVVIDGYDGSVTDVEIPETIEGLAVRTIGANAFSDSEDLKKVTIANSVTSIAYYAFENCTSLTELNFPEELLRIDFDAFNNCDSLTKVELGEKVEIISYSAFNHCDNLEGIYVDSANQHYCNDTHGTLYSKDKWTLIQAGCAVPSTYIVPADVGYIVPNAFATSKSLEILAVLNPTCNFYQYWEEAPGFPEGVTLHSDGDSKVQAVAEKYGYNFSEHSFEDGACTICGTGSIIWHGMCGDNLTYTINERDGKLIIEGDGWMYSFSCAAPWESSKKYITEISLPEGLLNIGSLAFENCINLKKLAIPDSVATIENNAFLGCESLERVDFGDGVQEIQEQAFGMCTALTDVALPEATAYIDRHAFALSGLTSIEIPNRECEIYDYVDFGGENTLGAPATTVIYGYADSTAQAYAEKFGYEFRPLCEHEYTATVTVPTCTEAGFSTFLCGKCGKTYIGDDTDALGHDFEQWKTTTVPTCTVEGVERRDCTRCDAYEERALEALGHSYTEAITMPTCTEGGYTTFTCHCGDSYVDDETAALGHSFEEWKTVTAPTCTNSGKERRDCSACDAFEERAVAKLAHNYDGGVCESCGAEDPNYVPPTEPSEEPSEPSEEPSEPSEPEIPTENPFTDVKESDYFATPVLWAVGKGITNGMSATSFAPNAPCTRGQIVTFLWRACGSPEPTKTDNPFTDVKSSEYYYKAVLWAVENGITTGLSATTFGPNATCTRGQVATFLWRSQGEPAPASTNNPFSDVKTSDYYCKAVLWAVENNVTQGVGGGKFAPNDSCTRGQIVTFLYRAIA